MAKFVGEHNAKLDDKGRLVFPQSFASLLHDDNLPLRLVIKHDLFANCLSIYTYVEWEKESEAIKAKLNFFNPEHNAFWRGYMSNRALVEPDDKLRRFTIPKKMLQKIQVKKNVVFCGCDFKIELWAKEVYEANIPDDEEFSLLASKILG